MSKPLLLLITLVSSGAWFLLAVWGWGGFVFVGVGVGARPRGPPASDSRFVVVGIGGNDMQRDLGPETFAIQ